MAIAFGGVMGFVLLVTIISLDLKTFLMMVGLSVGIALYFRFMRAWGIKDMKARARAWVQTDDGLQCTYGEPPETETIRWSQIRRMEWAGPGGLLFFWEEAGARGPQFRDEFREGDIAGEYRGKLRAWGKKEAG